MSAESSRELNIRNYWKGTVSRIESNIMELLISAVYPYLLYVIVIVSVPEPH